MSLGRGVQMLYEGAGPVLNWADDVVGVDDEARGTPQTLSFGAVSGSVLVRSRALGVAVRLIVGRRIADFRRCAAGRVVPACPRCVGEREK